MHSKDSNAPIPEIILIRPDERLEIPARSSSGGAGGQEPRPRRGAGSSRRTRSSRRRQFSSDGSGEAGDFFQGKTAEASDDKVTNDEPKRRASGAAPTDEYKETVQMLAPDDDQEGDNDEESIEVVPQRPKRRTRRIQRRSSLDPGMLRGSDAPRRRPNTRSARRGSLVMSAKHRSEPAVTFSYSDECLSSSISDLETDTDELTAGILSHVYDPYVSDDATGECALILPRGEDGTATSGAEELMTLGDLCASLIPPKIVAKPSSPS